MRKQFHISNEEFNEIIRINKEKQSLPLMKIGDTWTGGEKQKTIDDYWEQLGKKHGFDPTTIQPIDNRNFTAEVVEIEKPEQQDQLNQRMS